MNAAAAYVHALDGRLRIKSGAVKKSPRKAIEVEQQLQRRPGVTEVSTNPTTGSVLVLYDSRQIQQDDILDTLRALGCLPAREELRTDTREGAFVSQEFDQGLLRTVMVSTMEFAVQRLVYALI